MGDENTAKERPLNELEMLNEELRRVKSELKDSRNRFKHAEEELRKAQAVIDELDEKTEHLYSLNMYNKAIIQSMSQGMIVLSNSDIITTWNPAAEEILGINEEDAIGKNIFSIISKLGINIDEIRQKIRRIDKRRMIPHVIMQECTVQSGENKLMKLTMTPLTDIAGKSQGKMILFQVMDITTLREKAERELKSHIADLQNLSTMDLQSLVHELQVHQIELEMQNEELHRAQIELEESRSRYSDLYDFAPIGYFTFDKNGLIIEVNLTGANILGVERGFLINKPFSFYTDFGSRDVFYLHLRKVFETGTKKTCEIRLANKDGNQFDALLESQAVQDREGNTSQCRSVVIDLAELKVKADIS